MTNSEICDHCGKLINDVYSNNRMTINKGIFCENSVDEDYICNTFMCNSCIKFYFKNRYDYCYFCVLPIHKIE